MADIWETCWTATKTGRTPSARRMYMVRGTEDEREVRLLVLETAPLDYEGVLGRQHTQQDHLGGGVWRCSVDYGLGDLQTTANPMNGGGGGSGGGGGGGSGGGEGGSNSDYQPGATDAIGAHVAIEIGGRTQHVTQALAHVITTQWAGDTRPLPDHKGAIGVSEQGVEGCDVIMPTLDWTETWTWHAQYITWEYVTLLFRSVGRVNGLAIGDEDYDGSFRTFSRGEVMLMGVSINEKGESQMQAVYRFHAEPNVADFRLTPDFDPVDKAGHEYLWVEYERDADAANRLKVPRAVHVEEVGRPRDESSIPGMFPDADGKVNRIDFRFLGIGR